MPAVKKKNKTTSSKELNPSDAREILRQLKEQGPKALKPEAPSTTVTPSSSPLYVQVSQAPLPEFSGIDISLEDLDSGPPADTQSGNALADIDLSDLYAEQGKYTPQQKIGAVMAYFQTGSSRKAEKLSRIPSATIRWWKMQAVWWEDVYKACQKHYQDQLDTKFTDMLHRTADQMIDRVQHGNVIYDPKTDTFKRVPINGKDLAVMTNAVFSNRQLLRGDVTSRSESSGTIDNLKKLSEQFEKMYDAVQARTIQGTHTITNVEDVQDGTK